MGNDKNCKQKNKGVSSEQEVVMFHKEVYAKPKLVFFGKLQGVTLGATGDEIDSPTTSRPLQTV